MIYLLTHLDFGMIDTAKNLFDLFGKATPAIYAAVPSILGFVLFLWLRKGSQPHLRWIATIPLVIGLILGIFAWMLLGDTVYMAMTLPGPKTELIYRAVPIIPIVAGIAMFIMDRFVGQTAKSEL